MLLVACVPSASPDAQPDSVVVGRATWDTGWFQAEVFKQLLEELDYTVVAPDPQTLEQAGYTIADNTTLNPDDFYPAAAEGLVDMWPNGWFPNHNTFIEQQEVEGKVELLGFQVRAGALQGYLVDTATADEYDITSLEDLQDAEIAAAFDRDGNGKADLIGCNSGWGCELTIEHHLNAYDLRDTVEHVQGKYETLMSETVARYQDGESILFYTWTPNWTIGKLIPGEDVVWIEVPFASLPEGQHELEELTTIDGVVGCVSDPCNLGFPPNDIRVVANETFLRNNPAARRLLELVEISLTDISQQNALMFDGENTDEDIQRHASDWIEENRVLVDEWLAAARASDEEEQ
jgi:glycine betaine/proline transport system substrate-binding protein